MTAWHERKKEELNQKIESAKREARRIQTRERQQSRRAHYKKLLRAGMIFADLGILDTYDRQQVMTILQEAICKQKGES